MGRGEMSTVCVMALGWGLRYTKGTWDVWGSLENGIEGSRVLSVLLKLRGSGVLVFKGIASHGIFGKCLKFLLERELEGSLPSSLLPVPWLTSGHSFLPMRHHCGA